MQSSEGLSRCPCSMVLPWPFSQAKLLFVVRIAGIIKMSPKTQAWSFDTGSRPEQL